jgi:hypothetical protein
VNDQVRAVVLVEGVSDQVALETIARRRGRDLAAEGIAVVAMGGARNIGRYLARYGPGGLGLELAGLCDAGEEGEVRRGLERAGLGVGQGRAGLEAAGFYVCVADLEDELIRGLGTAATERIIAAQGELRSFRTLQRQPAQRDRSLSQQLHRFLGSGGGRKLRYARLLADALDPLAVPRPLDRVLDRLGPRPAGR